MIVPRYWAEAKERQIISGRQVTLKRFGWSDEGQAQAEQHAKARLAQAFEDYASGKEQRKTDHKIAYNGAEGLPIREEIVEYCGDSVITRNSYGALCLNTPDVLFADIDFELPQQSSWMGVLFFIGALLTFWIEKHFCASYWVILSTLLGFVLAYILSKQLRRLHQARQVPPEVIAMQRIEAFAAQHPDWHLRCYRTPMGYRLLAMHQLFDPRSREVEAFFQAVRADSIYTLMCQNQNCFRARLSAKPWRINVEKISSYPAVWPIKEERLAARQVWVQQYQQKAAQFAACRFEKTLGSDRVEEKAQQICQIHDAYTQALTALPLA